MLPSEKNKSNGILIFAVIGLLVAGGVFAFTFVTTQKAKTPYPNANLKLKVPVVPPRSSLTPLFVPSATPAAPSSLPTPSATPPNPS
ncbi:MAG: hypothetical protein UV61_C0003G0061 [Candidatus Gottesmanbacteria bacterium GW2011_GWB1_43_11]|uniref:Uncharacterized protein n=1 Tax=Candidatus Gottesmanbacteria bacterium GW2011_GWB1_43_11 TaxID=1618446 RepID=A0A0G1FK18_9BACT|nr:MAG: hypothetical protein UV04_C0002G0062 [Candidatus Gottesmanbacteria bacterium GW2011_GWA2_42_16]KKS56164.1 MAG: hypothetical protein UV17_C0002G0061 [Candidatus Gottesmanbacteria bacterium GW2011_GWA1_42_26]KKS82485.1 MAG: hypothetical protein UV55_C0002G0063 [Candidatus Gottesmanbacteria bacterium GW2011_GWC1_43_10]KKS87208.1 MAG: hypothetical protein UV61_C0003G0061 [Candidatus Gottesmanbacteria bacterium GW2011_GWB1_43_11]